MGRGAASAGAAGVAGVDVPPAGVEPVWHSAGPPSNKPNKVEQQRERKIIEPPYPYLHFSIARGKPALPIRGKNNQPLLGIGMYWCRVWKANANFQLKKFKFCDWRGHWAGA